MALMTNDLFRSARTCGWAVLLAVSGSPALADVKAGVDAWSAGDFVRAVAEWQGPAEAGDSDALFNLAQAYRLGRGVEADSDRARELYSQAAAKGHVKAADNYGLMLFQEGEQEKAMPLVQAAADRGDPRAQYVVGLAHFNGDYAPRDWVRAYALTTLAQGAGLPQASGALEQMDRYIPLAQRSQAQSLARQLEENANRKRSAELAAADFAGRPATGLVPAAAATAAATPTPAPMPAPPRVAAMPALSPAQAVRAAPADLAPAAPVAAASTSQPGFSLPATGVAAPARVAASPAPRAPAPRTGGSWRVQLGAFGVADNADKLWNRLSGKRALSGTQKLLVPTGKITRLQAVGFASKSAAEQACVSLKSEGQACLVAGNN